MNYVNKGIYKKAFIKTEIMEEWVFFFQLLLVIVAPRNAKSTQSKFWKSRIISVHKFNPPDIIGKERLDTFT